MNAMGTTQTPTRSLNEPWELGGVTIPNRVVLAPLAGIGNWFVRLQAKRHGAGLTVSEMVSSHAVHYGNERTCTELLRIHPDEHPVSVQLFGADPDVMASAAERVAAAGADLIDINMGCPVPKVCKTGAGAALLDDPDRAVAVARAAAQGQRPAGHGQAAHRPATRRWQGGRVWPATSPSAARSRGFRSILGTPRSATAASRTTSSRRSWWRNCRCRCCSPAGCARRNSLARPLTAPAPTRSCSHAVRSAIRGCSSNSSAAAPASRRVRRSSTELNWVLDCAVEHLGAERANRYLRKFYPWYIERLGGTRGEQAALQAALQQTDTIEHARELFAGAGTPLAGWVPVCEASWAGTSSRRSILSRPRYRTCRGLPALAGFFFPIYGSSAHAQGRHSHSRRSRRSQV